MHPPKKPATSYKIFSSVGSNILKSFGLIMVKNLISSAFFDCVFAWNHGASFSLFAEYHQYSNTGFFILNSLITLYMIWLFITSKYIMEVFSYSLLIGGALGNLIDVIMHGAVFDFIRIHYTNYDFPIFNLADSYITIGSILLLLQFFINKNSADKNI